MNLSLNIPKTYLPPSGGQEFTFSLLANVTLLGSIINKEITANYERLFRFQASTSPHNFLGSPESLTPDWLTILSQEIHSHTATWESARSRSRTGLNEFNLKS